MDILKLKEKGENESMRNTPPLEKLINEEKSKITKAVLEETSRTDIIKLWADSLKNIEDYLKQRNRY